MNDSEARRRIREELGTSFVVEAAAGTGKTTALIERIVAVVRAGADLSRVVAVTFTDRAAGELQLRLREELEKARRDARERGDDAEVGRFRAALEALELAPIGTIHSFCADLLRERPVEARVDPGFETAAEEETAALAARAFDEWFQHVLADPPPGVRRVLRLRGWSWDEGPRELLRKAARELIEHRDFDARWSRPALDRGPRMEALVAKLRPLAELASECPDPKDYLRRAFEKLARFLREVDGADEARARRSYANDAERERDLADAIDRREADLRRLAKDRQAWGWIGYGKRYGEHDRFELEAKRDALKLELDHFIADAEADLAAELQEELWPVVVRFEELCAKSGRLDFLDHLVRVQELLVSDAEVRASLQDRFTHIFVDEFQDTDPLQAEILLLLASADAATRDWQAVEVAAGKLFVVGDPKQSVYRFRRADVSVYELVRERITAAGGEVLELSTSFRARPSLQRFVNEAFAPLMRDGERGVQAKHVELGPHREELASQPTVVAVPLPTPYGDFGRKPFMSKVEECAPDAIAAFTTWLLRESGWLVEDATGARAVRSGDVCFLFSRMRNRWQGDLTVPYVRALGRRGIAHVLQGGSSFHEREEIIALRQALTAIEWPDDGLAVYATLRGPLLSISDDVLLRHRQAVGSLHPFAEGEGEPVVHDAMTLLRGLHETRNQRPVADTLAALLEATRAHAGFAFWSAPRQTLANVSRLLDQARSFDERGATSFRAFVRWLDDQAERAATGDAPFLEDSAEGVRLMTVHKAKGLEFPVVVLCDPTARATFGNPSRHVDAGKRLWATPLANAAPLDLQRHGEEVLRADAAERVRLAYVAATRARDLLVVPAVGDDVMSGWLEGISAPLYPADRESPAAIPGAPDVPTGRDTVLQRNDKIRDPRPVTSGYHRTADGVSAAWWDPRSLELQAPPRPGLRRQGLLARDGAAADEHRETHATWREQRAEAALRAAVPSVPVRTVTELALEELPRDEPVAVLRTGAWYPERPTGARFGTLVHAVLAEIPFDAQPAAIDGLVAAHARLLGAPDAERQAASEAVHRALELPLMKRAAKAGPKKEWPVAHALPDGTILEGVIDLAFRETDAFGEARWYVVDYKTDLAAGAPDEYVTQVQLYARAVAEATGEEVEGLLLGV